MTASHALECFPVPKFPENFAPGQTEMERFGPGGNLSCQSGPPPEVVLFDRPVQSDIAVPFSEIFVSSPAPACHHSQNGGWFRCKCLRVQCV